ANLARATRLDVIGPYDATPAPSPASLTRIYACGHLHGGHVPACAGRILTPLARRAYRRPVTPADVDPLVALVSAPRRGGESFEAGLALALQAVLVSPDFLLRTDPGRTTADGQPGRGLTDHELASRLSYFLWASMPNDELLDLADRGTLSRPEVTEAQVRRMLKDPKAEALVEAFGGPVLRIRSHEC